MKNTESYFNILKAYFDATAAVDAEYQAELARAKRFEGSDGGRDMVKAATAKRDAALQAERDYTRSKMKPVLDAMRQRAKGRTLTPPTAEQQAIIAALRARKELTKEEIRQAENSLAGCPLALRQLDEIAQDHGYRKSTPRTTAMPTEDVLDHIDRLEANFNHSMKGEKARFNRVPKDVGSCMGTWGDFWPDIVSDEWGRQHTVTSRAVGPFSEAVDGE